MNYAEPLSVLEVHLDAVARNWLSLKKMLRQGADCAAVVKANAYGLGAVQVSRALFDQGCRHFFVAHIDEARAVDAALAGRGAANAADLPSIYVLNGPWGAPAHDFLRHGFIPVLNSPGDIQYWADSAPGKPALIHIDTGMNRLGLSPAEAESLDRDLLKKIDLRYVMSHLACADEAAHPKNAQQLELFRKLTALWQRPLRYSLANSAGIFLGADYHFDLARPGCALYGINPQSGQGNRMQNAVTLKGRIMQTRDAAAGDSIGYGAGYICPSPLKLATVSIGYADGYLRHLTGRGVVVIANTRCAVLGRVSMDSIVADVTQVPGGVAAGGWAEVIGPQQPVDAVARQAGTIGYEILTSLGARYKRIYTGI